jgi:hypothetical protein
VIVRIYVEGGGDNKDTLKRCTEGFTIYCQKLVPEFHRPRVVACGARDHAFERFCTAVRNSQAGETSVLLVDAEERVVANSCVQHLHLRDRWNFPKLDHHQVFLIVQAMEAWFLADRDALRAFYGDGFLSNSLPGNPRIEEIPKGDLEPALKSASKSTKTKGEYHKVRHGFELLARIDPLKVEKSSPHAKALNDFLRAL